MAGFDTAQVAATQVVMSRHTWTALQARGVGDVALLSLDYVYNAPNEAAARQLAAFLRDDSGYNARVVGQKSGRLARRTWTVAGTVDPTEISLPVLEDWVRWMVAAGAEHGACEFDGWGAPVPG